MTIPSLQCSSVSHNCRMFLHERPAIEFHLKVILSIRNLSSHLSTQLDIDIIYLLDCTRAFPLWFCILPGGLSAWCLVCILY